MQLPIWPRAPIQLLSCCKNQETVEARRWEEPILANEPAHLRIYPSQAHPSKRMVVKQARTSKQARKCVLYGRSAVKRSTKTRDVLASTHTVGIQQSRGG